MHQIHIIIISILIANSYQNLDYDFCDTTTKICENSVEEFESTKLLFYDVNPPEGFNLRRDVYMRFAIMLSDAQKRGKRLNWRLVLPPFYRLYHWRSSTDKNKPMPWGAFFDIDSFRSFAPILDLHEVFSQSKLNKLEIDILYVLQNFEDPFENGLFEDKWKVNNDCDYEEEFWGYNNITSKETICVRFQGRISKLWEIINLHPNAKKVMIAHGEIPLHDNYGTKTYWDCRKSMKFNEKLVNRATEYISKNFNCSDIKCNKYISVHWRRQDFAYSRSNDVPSILGTAKQIYAIQTKHYPHIKSIFIASDAKVSEIDKLESLLKDLGFKVYFYIPSMLELDEYKDGGIAIIDQIICSHSVYFIGTHESTFTFRIQEEREILGYNSNTTFNRLCPDKGHCEKPSKWTIIN